MKGYAPHHGRVCTTSKGMNHIKVMHHGKVMHHMNGMHYMKGYAPHERV